MASKNYQSNYCYFTVNCSNSISGSYPNIKHRISFTISITAVYGCQWNGAVLNFAGKSKSVNVNVGAGTQSLWSDYVEYDFGTKSRTHSVTLSFSTSFGNVSASGSQTESATITLPTINSSTLTADAYNKISYSASLSSNPYDFYTISSCLNDNYLIGTEGTWNDVSANTSYTVIFYVVAKGDTFNLLDEGVSKNVTTPKPDKPTKGSLFLNGLTYKSASISWSGFTAGAGASISKYQYSNDDSYWTYINEPPLVFDELSAYTEYTVYVRAVDNYNQVSESEKMTFRTSKPDKPTKGTVTVHDITPFGCHAYWSGFSVSPGATGFYYQYSFNGTEWTSYGIERDIVFSDLNPETKYTIWIRIVDNFGTVSDAASVSFTTLVDQVKMPVVINGKINSTRMWMVKDGQALKTKRVYVVQNGSAKKLTNDW